MQSRTGCSRAHFFGRALLPNGLDAMWNSRQHRFHRKPSIFRVAGQIDDHRLVANAAHAPRENQVRILITICQTNDLRKPDDLAMQHRSCGVWRNIACNEQPAPPVVTTTSTCSLSTQLMISLAMALTSSGTILVITTS
jgi:hypothetical protein